MKPSTAGHQKLLDPIRENAPAVAARLKLLAHPQRLMLLCHLIGGEKSVQELTQSLGVSQVVVSQFLAKLKAQGLVEGRRDGQFTRYRIHDPRVFDLLKSLKTIFCE